MNITEFNEFQKLYGYQRYKHITSRAFHYVPMNNDNLIE